EVLVLGEKNAVVAADGGEQHDVRVERSAGTDDAQSGNGGEHHGPGLRMVDGTALEISAIGDAHDGGGAERVVGTPAQRGELVAKLVIGGPDVVEELDLDDRLQPTGGEADRPTHDVGLGQGRVVDAPAAELPLQPPGDLENAALAF